MPKSPQDTELRFCRRANEKERAYGSVQDTVLFLHAVTTNFFFSKPYKNNPRLEGIGTLLNAATEPAKIGKKQLCNARRAKFSSSLPKLKHY